MFSHASALTPGARMATAQGRAAVGPRAPGTALSTIALLQPHRQHQSPAQQVHQVQQTRGFRFAWWAATADRETHRRHRALRHKCADAVNRRLLWELQTPAATSSAAAAAATETQRSHRRHFGRARHDAQPKRCFAFSRLCARDGAGLGHESSASASSSSSPFDGMRNYLARHRHADFLSDARFGMHAQTPAKPEDSATDYVIDPITNRKVLASASAPSLTFKSYRSRFTSSAAAPSIDMGLPPTPQELRAYEDAANASASADTDSADLDTSNHPRAYDDLHKYTPIQYNEPDGKAPEAETETEPAYDPEELDKYRPVAWNEPDGQPAEPPVEIGHEGYDPTEVQKYKPFRWNEPDGQPAPSPASPAPAPDVPDPEELAKYKPFRWNEPDGQPAAPSEEASEAHGHDTVEVQKYKPFMWNEPDGRPADASVELGTDSYDPAEVQKYRPFSYQEPDGQTPKIDEAVDAAELASYRHFVHQEPDGQALSTEDAVDAAELASYRPVSYQEPDGQTPNASEEVVDAAELASYRPFAYQEPDGQPTALAAEASSNGLSDYDANASGAPEMSDEAYASILRRLGSLTNLDGEEAEQAAMQSSPSSQSSQSSSSSHRRARKPLTDAERAQALVDPYSTAPQGLETSFAQERAGAGAATRPMYVRTHRRTDRGILADMAGAVDAASPATPQTVAAPTAYQILAYDPAARVVSMASTVSTVADAATPMTPAEALLCVNQPAAFLPHLEPLQAQGFEIVSGRGDVLVFRRVRTAASAVSKAKATAGPADLADPTPLINPIDMTGQRYMPPSTANFVSPTGYVNLDLPPLDACATVGATDLPSPPPIPEKTKTETSATAQRIPSNIDVRRQEPVFSGPKNKDRPRRRSSEPGVAKRMVVGATWVAGVSYALGLASELFKGP